MSTDDHPALNEGGDAAAGQNAAVAASEATKSEQKPTGKPQPFKLPYSNQFDVVFKDVHDLKGKDRIYSEPVTFGPLKWYEEAPLCQRTPFLVFSSYTLASSTVLRILYQSRVWLA